MEVVCISLKGETNNYASILMSVRGTIKHSVSVTCCALLVSSISLSYAAEVPSGTVLAEKQQLVRHIKDEPASLDPAKAVGLPEIQVIRDLFEGLVNQDAKGETWSPAWRPSWQSNDNRVWTFTLRDDARWADGTPVTARGFRLQLAASGGPENRYRRSPGSRRWRGSPTRRTIIDGKAAPETSWGSPPSMPTRLRDAAG